MDRYKAVRPGQARAIRPHPTELDQFRRKHQGRTLVGDDKQLLRPRQPGTPGFQHARLVGIRKVFCQRIRSGPLCGAVAVFLSLLFGSLHLLAAHAG